MSKFLAWSYHSFHDSVLDPHQALVVAWLKALTTCHYALLLPFSNFLQVGLHQSPSTIINWMGDIQSSIEWATLFAPVSIKLAMSDIEGIKAVAKRFREIQSKLQRKMRSHKTMEGLVRDKKMPRGGILELQSAVLALKAWVTSLPTSDINKRDYDNFMQLLFSALYVFSPNGRQGGVMDMKFCQAEDLHIKNFATTTKFKTNCKYGFQPVTVDSASYELLMVYLNTLRPQASRLCHDGPDEPLWLTYYGNAIGDAGKRVTRFFKRTLGLHISTTRIRSLVETEVHKLFKQGRVTQEQKMSVQNINGHSSEVTEAFYLMEQREEDVRCTKGVLTKDLDVLLDDLAKSMSAEDLREWAEDTVTTNHIPVPPLPLPRNYHAPAPPQPLNWGTQHPAFNCTTKTAVWTDAEKQYVGTWCEDFRYRFPGASNAIAKCLQHIRGDPEAVAIFHKYHTDSSDRLRNGYRQYEREKSREGLNSEEEGEEM